jgi:hypothetical protein
MNDAQHLADRYAAVWNETDDTRRRAAIADLWPATGVHYVNARVARGHDELELRIAESHRKNVRDRGFRFRARRDARTLRDVVTFHWEMVRPADDQVLAVGLEFLRVDADGRIEADYQFIVA